MKLKTKNSKQSGVALIVALVALLILTLLGVSTMSNVISQSAVVRNEQFRQKVFYAASSELNVQIDAVNRNSQNEDDPIIDSLQATGNAGIGMELQIAGDEFPQVMTTPEDVLLTTVLIKGDRVDHVGCPGESIGKVKVIAGEIDATAALDDGRGAIKSSQRQRYVYCWP